MDDFKSLKSFLLIIGNARSGSTILGSVINSHPQAIIANETKSSGVFWNKIPKDEILADIKSNVSKQNCSVDLKSGYKPIPKVNTPDRVQLLIMGDKIWNPATLILHGKNELKQQLSNTLGLPIYLLHAIRNPFDVIATMHLRSGASIADRTEWYFMHCEAVKVIKSRCTPSEFLHVYHEDLITNPDSEIRSICCFLNLPVNLNHLEVVKQSLYRIPNESRYSVQWSKDEWHTILKRMENFKFLHKYML
jgi:hypothetical protein